MTPRRLEVLPRSRHRWIVRFEDDPAELGEHPTQTDAVAAARIEANAVGAGEIVVHELDGETRVEFVDPQFRPQRPSEAKGTRVKP
jgi:hypothetical protein